ncbi:hypothetical protein HIM_06773 [Hirsutella minnesotensis 3608]|uniref:Uncharacterized protein n=1 Tax=Hirsutella minnesotensis 3608 TaxID=1043627 RepID=A0A0F7ZNJ9_9HYPO|nr:hypothetical protein HIM_06773 [Hirsutella minnesotensis 3608]
MTERARKTGLDTGSSPLLGSKFFPPDLLATCAAHDPRAIMFGCDAADAAQGWCRDDDGGAPFELDDRVYEGVGHWFSAAMVEDAVGFLVRVVDEGPRARGAERRARM